MGPVSRMSRGRHGDERQVVEDEQRRDPRAGRRRSRGPGSRPRSEPVAEVPPERRPGRSDRGPGIARPETRTATSSERDGVDPEPERQATAASRPAAAGREDPGEVVLRGVERDGIADRRPVDDRRDDGLVHRHLDRQRDAVEERQDRALQYSTAPSVVSEHARMAARTAPAGFVATRSRRRSRPVSQDAAQRRRGRASAARQPRREAEQARRVRDLEDEPALGGRLQLNPPTVATIAASRNRADRPASGAPGTARPAPRPARRQRPSAGVSASTVALDDDPAETRRLEAPAGTRRRRRRGTIAASSTCRWATGRGRDRVDVDRLDRRPVADPARRTAGRGRRGRRCAPTTAAGVSNRSGKTPTRKSRAGARARSSVDRCVAHPARARRACRAMAGTVTSVLTAARADERAQRLDACRTRRPRRTCSPSPRAASGSGGS